MQPSDSAEAPRTYGTRPTKTPDAQKKEYRVQFLRLLRKLCMGGNNRSVAAIQNEVPADDLIGTLKRRLDKTPRPDPELTQQLVMLLSALYLNTTLVSPALRTSPALWALMNTFADDLSHGLGKHEGKERKLRLNYLLARRDSAEHFFRSNALHCTAMARILIPAECSAVS